jgi:AraC-like DNA-binding protein
LAVTRYIPSPPLDAHINCFWYSGAPAPYSHLKMLPMPSLHLMVNFGDTFHVYKRDAVKPFATCSESWSVGLWSDYHIMDLPVDMQIINVSFKPGGAYPFLQLPLAEMHNQIVSLDAIWGHFAAEVRERLYTAPSTQARFVLLERLLLARLCAAPHGLNVAQYAIAQIARSHGALSIRALCDDIGISQKHLIAQFKRLVGATPKELARLYRFRHVLDTIDLTQPVDWMRLARQAHYYDQSHFNRDFEALSGHSPTEYLKLRYQIHAAHPERAPYLDHLPTG